MKIVVAGTGYVGLSIASLLSQHNEVVAVDVIPEKVDLINQRRSPIQDEYIEKYLAEKELNLRATLDGASAYGDADFVVIEAPTNYDPIKNFFDTHHIEDVIELVLSVNPSAVMVIKSTIPVGYCRSLYVRYAAKGVKDSIYYFHRNFFARVRRSMTIYIPLISLLATPNSFLSIRKKMKQSRLLQMWTGYSMPPRHLSPCFNREHSRRISQHFSWV